jgi:hypothetical protein
VKFRKTARKLLTTLAGLFAKALIIKNLWSRGNCPEPRKGTPPAFPISAQQLGNGAIVERLRRGRSFFGVRARGEGSKGYAEKGAPTKKFPSRESLAAVGTDKMTQSERACENPKMGL